MKLLSIAAVALLVDISASFYLTDDNQTFQSEPKLPRLDDKFEMNCISAQTYRAKHIRKFAKEAYSKYTRGELDAGTFTRFPGVTVYKYNVGNHYVRDVGYAYHHILIDEIGTFLAGMLEYPSYGGMAYSPCKFSIFTGYESYANSRQLNTQDDEVYDVSKYDPHFQQPPIGSSRGTPGESSRGSSKGSGRSWFW